MLPPTSSQYIRFTDGLITYNVCRLTLISLLQSMAATKFIDIALSDLFFLESEQRIHSVLTMEQKKQICL